MTNQRKNLLASVFLLVIVSAVSVYIFNDLRKSTTKVVQPANKDAEIKPISLDNQALGGYKITVLPSEEPKSSSSVSAKMPDLSLPVKNYSRLDETAFKVISQNMAKITISLKKDPNNELGWLNLAVYRKMLGDYTGAAQILDYVVVLWPTDYAPYNNLADIYQFYVKNYPLAEKNWLKVTELKPDYSESYKNLHDLYVTLYPKNKEQSLPILLKGLERNPGSIDLIIYISRFYRSLGDKDNALLYYSKAVSEAKSQGNQQVVDSIEAEASELSK